MGESTKIDNDLRENPEYNELQNKVSYKLPLEKSKLKDYANKLTFDMNDEEYKTLQEEFEIILKQMRRVQRNSYL